MSIQAPQGILNIPNAILRVGKLSVDEVVGADTILNTVARNTILLVDDEAYHENKNWSLKLPNAWAGEFECNTASAGNYSEFNFYNEGASSNVQGYNLTFNDTAVELRYDGTLLKTGTLASTITGTGVKKVRLMFERTILSVTVDGTLVFTHDDTVGPRPRVYSTTAGGFLNFFTNGGALKNLKIVNEKWMSDGTSNIAYVGGGEVAVGQALAFNRVSNVSQIKVDSNVVTEYTGPHDRPLRKYPEVALTSASQGGYVVDKSEESSSGDAYAAYRAFDGIIPDGTTTIGWRTDSGYNQDTGLADGGVTRFTGDSGEWVELQLPNSIKLSSIVLKVGNQGNNLANSQRRFPKVFVIYGYNGTSWDRIQEYTTSAIQSLTDVQTFHISNPTAYHNKFVLVVKQTYSVTGATSGVTNIGELEYYGYEEGSGSLDTTLKSVYNVPATTGTQLEVYYDAKDLTTMPSIVTDLSPNTNNGTVSGDPQVSNGAFVFDGVGDSIGGSVTNGTGELNFTISMWVKPNVLDDSPFLFGENTNTKGFGMDISSGVINLFVVGGTAQRYNTSDLLHVGEWSHLIFYRNNGEMSIYKNGIYIYPTRVGSGALDLNVNTQFTVGSRDTSKYFTGSIANFRLYSKALNADQVKELYDYQKDYFLGSKSQVTLYKGHLGVGVTEPSGQLELAGDERIQEYPPGPMDDYETLIPGHGVFEVYSSANGNTGFENWNAFDKVSNPGWSVAGNFTSGNYTGSSYLGDYKGEYLVLKLPYAIKLKSIGVIPRSAVTDRYPSDYTIVGSNDGNVWSSLKSFSGLTYTDTHQTINSDITYSYFGMVVTKLNQTSTGDRIILGEWQLFGTPGPTTLDKGSLTLGRSLDVPRISRYDVDTETPRPEKLVVDFDTTVNSSPTDISGQGNHGTFYGGAYYSAADKAFVFGTEGDGISTSITNGQGAYVHSVSIWFKADTLANCIWHLGTDGGGAGSDTSSVFVDTNGNFGWFFWANDVAFGGIEISTGTWNHMVCVYDGGTASTSRRLWLNGIERTITSTSGSQINQALSIEANTTLRLASRPANTTVFDGQISNFKLYNVALEASEVRKLYNLGRTGRSMVISDTAVGIGKVPEAQLDVRGTAKFASVTNFHTGKLVGTNAGILSALEVGGYEEGNWTPEFDFVTVTMGNSYGKYVRLGSLVYVTFDMSYSSLNTSDTSGVHISGLPFPQLNGLNDGNQPALLSIHTDKTTMFSLAAGGGRYGSSSLLITRDDHGGNGFIAYNSCAASGRLVGCAMFMIV
jgi:hypothetical protein